jgi:hypothetical protein
MNMPAPENRKALELFTSVVTAWRDVRDGLSALFAPAMIAFLILLARGIVRTWIMPSTGLTAGAELEQLTYDAVEAFVMTPYAIAVHRFIILGEKTMSYRIAPAEPRFRRFFGWSLALLVLFEAPWAISAMFPSEAISAMLPSFKAFLLVLGILVLVVAIRTIILFPAVAVDAPGANWRQAMADTNGHAWHIFFIMLGAMLPFVIVAVIVVIVVGFILFLIIGENAGTRSSLRAFGMLSGAIGMLFGYTLAVVIASRLYQRIGVRVKERG